jgi:hypothetical protein
MAQSRGLSNQKMGFSGTIKIQNWEGRRVGVPEFMLKKFGMRHPGFAEASAVFPHKPEHGHNCLLPMNGNRYMLPP